MNAEASNPTSDTAGGSISLRKLSRVLLVVVPFFGLAVVGIGYTDLNIHQRMFVGQLGCGCAMGFNTNDLTWIIGYVCMGTTLAFWWLAACGLSWKPRLALTGAEFLTLFFGFLVTFVRHNYWL